MGGRGGAYNGRVDASTHAHMRKYGGISYRVHRRIHIEYTVPSESIGYQVQVADITASRVMGV